MSKGQRNQFNKRSFVSLMIFFLGAGLPVTGLANHLLQMEPMTPRRHAWMTAHNVLGILFVGFALWHIMLNRRAIMHAIRGEFTDLRLLSREALCAAGLIAAVLVIMVSHAFHVQ